MSAYAWQLQHMAFDQAAVGISNCTLWVPTAPPLSLPSPGDALHAAHSGAQCEQLLRNWPNLCVWRLGLGLLSVARVPLNSTHACPACSQPCVMHAKHACARRSDCPTCSIVVSQTQTGSVAVRHAFMGTCVTVQVWDHVLCNPPWFYPYVALSYLLSNRVAILRADAAGLAGAAWGPREAAGAADGDR